MTNRFSSDSGKPYSEARWLDNHHSIKSKLRNELVQNLSLKDGDRVLDIGCGTGNFVFLFADQVGHRGKIVGLDLDSKALELAAARHKLHHHRNRIDFHQIDVQEYSNEGGFDVVTIFNALCYIPHPSRFINSLTKLLKPGGRLIIKDSDLGSDFFWPVDRDLYHRLMSLVSNHGPLDNDDYYDPFFARTIPSLLESSPFESTSVMSQSFSFTYPVDEQQRQYIMANARMISDFAILAGIGGEADKWARLFDIEEGHNIFSDPGFLYSTTEFIFQARAPSSS